MKKGHKQLLIKRNLLILATIILVFISTTQMLLSCRNEILRTQKTSLLSTVHAISKQISISNSRDSQYNNSMIVCAEDLAGYLAYYIEKNGFNQKSCTELYSELSDYVRPIVFKGRINSDTQTISGCYYSGFNNTTGISFNIPYEAQYKLLENGFYASDNFNYTSRKVNDSTYVIIQWSAYDFILHRDILESIPSDYDECFIWTDNTGMIKDSTKSSLEGANIDSVIPKAVTDSLLNDTPAYVKLTNGTNAYLVSCNELGNDTLYAYVTIPNLVSVFLRSAAVPVILTVLFLILILVYMLGFMNPHSEDEKTDIEYFHLFRNIYSDSKLLSHNIALGLLSLLVIIFAAAYVKTLINYCSENVNASYNLNSLNSFINNSDTNLELMEEDFLDTNTLLCEVLADYYLKHPSEVNNEDLSNMLSHLPGIYDISMMDKTGTICVDTSTRVGYTLSSDTDSPESVCQSVLSGAINSVGYEQGLFYYVVSRRQDQAGLIRISIDSSPINLFRESCNIDEDLRSVNFHTSIKGYIPIEDTSKIYWLSSDSSNDDAVHVADCSLSDSQLNQSTFVAKINGKKYVVNLLRSDDYYLLSATNISQLNGLYNFRIILIVALTFMLQQLVIFILNLRTKEEVPEKKIGLSYSSRISESIDAQMMDNNFRKLVSTIALSAIILVVLLLISDSVLEKTSLLSYIFESSWPKGFNLFSMTMILISIVGGFFISKLLQLLLIFFTKNMGPRGLTIGRMLGSVVRFVALFIILILILMYLGVNYTALLAGAGIAGIAVTVCAQSSISDMLSGFLIVFENLFNIGDWITVDDFRGQVTEIGLRTTKIQISKTVRICNNSELRKVTVMERNGQGCIVNVDIAYKEDANKVIELLKNSTERFQKDIPAIVEGPYIDGIIDLGSSGVTLYIWAIADLEMIRATEREIRRVTKNIFDENHIEIPFNQVTIHEADEVRHFLGKSLEVSQSEE